MTGTGYAQNGFLTTCGGCSAAINRDTFMVDKLARDIAHVTEARERGVTELFPSVLIVPRNVSIRQAEFCALSPGIPCSAKLRKGKCPPLQKLSQSWWSRAFRVSRQPRQTSACHWAICSIGIWITHSQIWSAVSESGDQLELGMARCKY
jgi:hypothetical protein